LRARLDKERLWEDGMKTYRAVDVMNAVHDVYMDCGNGNKEYAKSKTNSFLRRCGADINKPKEQPLSADRVKEIAHAALDADAESRLFALLGRYTDGKAEPERKGAAR
jgi:hypothetical protein